ncbi:MAG: hypothetical protein ACOC5L_04080 [Halobacteriota archaeon]
MDSGFAGRRCKMAKKRIKLLIVDDEPAMREVMRVILNNFNVMEASNGYEA